MAEYITLKASDWEAYGLDKQFRATAFRKRQAKSGSIKETAGGELDETTGAVFEIHTLVLLVPEESVDPAWGTREDLEELHAYNNPSGSPSNNIIYTDYWGTEHASCSLTGNLDLVPVAGFFEGGCAWYLAPVTVTIKP